MADAATMSSGNPAADTSGAMSAGGASVDKLLASMNAAFALATDTNLKITIQKTVDGAEETAAQQRPNIG